MKDLQRYRRHWRRQIDVEIPFDTDHQQYSNDGGIRRHPRQPRQQMRIPRVDLIMQTPRKNYANEVAREQPSQHVNGSNFIATAVILL